MKKKLPMPKFKPLASRTVAITKPPCQCTNFFWKGENEKIILPSDFFLCVHFVVTAKKLWQQNATAQHSSLKKLFKQELLQILAVGQFVGSPRRKCSKVSGRPSRRRNRSCCIWSVFEQKLGATSPYRKKACSWVWAQLPWFSTTIAMTRMIANVGSAVVSTFCLSHLWSTEFESRFLPN